MELDVLPPTNDWVFKLLFGDERNKGLLIDLLQSLIELPAEEWEDLTFLDTYLKPESEQDKMSILDVKVRTKSGIILNIEIQVNKYKFLGKRISFYKSKLLVIQLGKGQGYQDIQKVICILITDHELFEGVADYVNGFQFYNRKNNLCFKELPEEIYTVEIPKAPVVDDGNKSWKWVRFLGCRKREEFEMVAQTSKQVRRAVDLLYELSANDEVRAEYDRQQKAWLDYHSMMEDHFLEGKEEGIEEGIAKGREEGITKGREEGITKGREEGIELGVKKEQRDLLALINQGYTLEQLREKLAASEETNA